MNYLIFDCETTGKADFNAPLDADHQPHIVQLAALLANDDGKELMQMNVIIRPDGYEIPIQSTAIHGISQEHAMSVGVSIKSAINLFEWMCRPALKHVAHNYDFDSFVLQSEFIRAFDDTLPFSGARMFCTMKAMTERCQLPGPYGYKWPKLIEAHRHCFGCDFDGAHDALADVRAAAKIFFWLKEKEKANATGT